MGKPKARRHSRKKLRPNPNHEAYLKLFSAPSELQIARASVATVLEQEQATAQECALVAVMPPTFLKGLRFLKNRVPADAGPGDPEISAGGN